MPRLRLLFFTLLLWFPAVASAENFSSTNVQLLYGNGFHDRFLGNNTTKPFSMPIVLTRVETHLALRSNGEMFPLSLSVNTMTVQGKSISLAS